MKAQKKALDLHNYHFYEVKAMLTLKYFASNEPVEGKAYFSDSFSFQDRRKVRRRQGQMRQEDTHKLKTFFKNEEIKRSLIYAEYSTSLAHYLCCSTYVKCACITDLY